MVATARASRSAGRRSRGARSRGAYFTRFALELTEGLDRVIEVGGAGTLARSINAVRDEGQISLIGVLAGWAQEVGVAPLIAKHVRIQGFTVGSRAAFENMNRAITVSNVRPVIDRTFTFSEARNALAYLENGGQFEEIVIRVS
jgi:NADPH:quinone reductase-like Zn-dependent oxidoreductase